ncbi:MAG: antibiotic biosynthesis monooxygenase family protein [Thermomicrobiales bacterium]
MYGTVARLQVNPGKEAAFKALNERWQRERKPEVKGFIASYALKSERRPSEWMVMAIFDTEEHYRENAADPEQHRQHERLRALLAADPEWNDGEILTTEPSAVPV